MSRYAPFIRVISRNKIKCPILKENWADFVKRERNNLDNIGFWFMFADKNYATCTLLGFFIWLILVLYWIFVSCSRSAKQIIQEHYPYSTELQNVKPINSYNTKDLISSEHENNLLLFCLQIRIFFTMNEIETNVCVPNGHSLLQQMHTQTHTLLYHTYTYIYRATFEKFVIWRMRRVTLCENLFLQPYYCRRRRCHQYILVYGQQHSTLQPAQNNIRISSYV